MRWKAFAQNSALVVGSCLVFAVLLEFVVFRFVLLPADMPRNAFVNGVIKYQPNQTGMDRVADDYAAPFRINADGWNSGHEDYREERTPGLGRIAVIGDSYVEAFQVAYDESLAERLEGKLAEAGEPTEVYRFGISGAPLSQYLQMLEREVVGYRPDTVAVLLVHNDFDESFRFVAGRYTSSYRKLRIEDGAVTGVVEPTAYQGTFEPLVQSATYRYLRLRQGLSFAPIRQLLLQGGVGGDAYAANIAIDKVLEERDKIEASLDFVMARFRALAEEHGFDLIVMMDADRGAIYGDTPEDRIMGPLALNEMARAAAAQHDVPFLDLHPVFKAEFQRTGQRFEYSRDWHWNEAAHELAAETLADSLLPGDRTASLSD